MNKLSITLKAVGHNGLANLRAQLDEFVRNNFELLYEGAIRLDNHIGADYYAPQRIQIGRTRLHRSQGLKIADGHHYSSEANITADQLRQTVKDIQTLIDAAAEDIPAPFSISIT